MKGAYEPVVVCIGEDDNGGMAVCDADEDGVGAQTEEGGGGGISLLAASEAPDHIVALPPDEAELGGATIGSSEER